MPDVVIRGRSYPITWHRKTKCWRGSVGVRCFSIYLDERNRESIESARMRLLRRMRDYISRTKGGG